MHQNQPPVGVVGAGVMGRGIVQLFAQAGYPVRFYDSRPGACDEAADFVVRMLRRAADKGSLPAAQLGAAMARVQPCRTLEELAGCELIVEAIVEDLPAKSALFAQLEALVPDGTLLASNTSSFPIAEIAAACRRPQRVIGLHFFNPVPLMKLAEVVPGVRTDPQTVRRTVALLAATGHQAVIAADQPGFLVNHAGRGLYTEGLRILEEGVAQAADVDRVLREACGFRMGPFELMDLTGLDVAGPVMQSIYTQFQQEPRFRPSSLLPPRVAAGLFGRKSGAGFYRYENERRVDPPEPAPPATAASTVWVDAEDDATGKLAAYCAAAGAQLAESPYRAGTIILVQPLGDDATHTCARRGLDPRRCVAVDPLTPLNRRRTLMLTCATTSDTRAAAHALLAADATPVTVINDSAGYIAQRVLATIVNIGCNLVQSRIASVADLETAVPVALGYPLGPLAWGDRIGPRQVQRILDRMLALSGDPRYRASPWLRRRAEIGLPLATPETPSCAVEIEPSSRRAAAGKSHAS
jgi:3-hydroxybutyryl-CoA dehydrogenase